MKHFRAHQRTMAAATVAAAFMVVTGAAHAIEFKISGHVNRMILGVDDGVKSETFHADNVNSQTRIRFTGSADVMPGLKAGINWEVGYTSNPSSGISMSARSVDATFNERHTEAYLLGGWGKVSFGQGDGAANGVNEVDLSGTSLIQYSGITDIGGGFAYRSGAVFGPTISSSIGNLDFESRYDRLRYDSPALGPLTASVSHGTKGEFDVTELAVRIAAEFGNGKVAAALGYSTKDIGGVAGDEQTAGSSLSWLHRSGFNLTLAHGRNENDNPARPDRKFTYGKVGYTVGKHAVSIDYGVGTDFVMPGDDAKVVGIGYVYSPRSWIELYAGAKQHSLDRVGSSFDDVTFVMAGTRLKF